MDCLITSHSVNNAISKWWTWKESCIVGEICKTGERIKQRILYTTNIVDSSDEQVTWKAYIVSGDTLTWIKEIRIKHKNKGRKVKMQTRKC